MKSIVYAASDATFIELDPARFRTPPATFARFGKVYRRLTPEYWAWFYRKYKLMETALTRKKISEAAFTEILDRIATLYNHAIALHGKEAMDAAVQTTDVRELDALIKKENGNLKDAAPAVIPIGGENARGHVPSIVAERGKNTLR